MDGAALSVVTRTKLDEDLAVLLTCFAVYEPPKNMNTAARST
jgi:hypothetical protein